MIVAAVGDPGAVGPWTFVILTIIGATGGSIITGLFMRPKVSADARTSNITAEVSLSADSREWVTQAMDRAQSAEAESGRLRTRMNSLEDDNDEMRFKFNLLIDYVLLLHRDWGKADRPPPPPAMLKLEPHHRPDDDPVPPASPVPS